MSVIPTYKTVSKKDVRKIPQNFEEMVDLVLKIIDPAQIQIKLMTAALQKGLTFQDNIKSEHKKNINVVADNAIEFTLQSLRDPIGAIGLLEDGYIVLKAEKVDSQTIRITPSITGTMDILVI